MCVYRFGVDCSTGVCHCLHRCSLVIQEWQRTPLTGMLANPRKEPHPRKAPFLHPRARTQTAKRLQGEKVCALACVCVCVHVCVRVCVHVCTCVLECMEDLLCVDKFAACAPLALVKSVLGNARICFSCH